MAAPDAAGGVLIAGGAVKRIYVMTTTAMALALSACVQGMVPSSDDPRNQVVQEAQAFLAAIRENSLSSYQGFLRSYPDSQYASQARIFEADCLRAACPSPQTIQESLLLARVAATTREAAPGGSSGTVAY